ncbi:hypothetical protein Anapl_16198 [Anas platyrhynchos]|uniref:Uncharacterized protein n=1 Tax=Anas platyrhynchos TaxID=8839 RepID=R0L1L5_ANAPL|nr:hypothetical protein Anapl_16198 [Anas platyrhynchos]
MHHSTGNAPSAQHTRALQQDVVLGCTRLGVGRKHAACPALKSEDTRRKNPPDGFFQDLSCSLTSFRFPAPGAWAVAALYRGASVDTAYCWRKPQRAEVGKRVRAWLLTIRALKPLRSRGSLTDLLPLNTVRQGEAPRCTREPAQELDLELEHAGSVM